MKFHECRIFYQYKFSRNYNYVVYGGNEDNCIFDPNNSWFPGQPDHIMSGMTFDAVFQSVYLVLSSLYTSVSLLYTRLLLSNHLIEVFS